MLPFSFVSPQGAVPGVSLSLPSSPSALPKEEPKCDQTVEPEYRLKTVSPPPIHCALAMHMSASTVAQGARLSLPLSLSMPSQKVDNGGGIVQIENYEEL
jgi:hypothetical protein